MNYVLSFDLGTSGVKAALFDENGGVAASSYIEYPTYCISAGMYEQKPMEWWESIVTAARELAETSSLKSNISAIGVSGHSLGMVAIGKDNGLLGEYTPIWSDARAVRESSRFFERVSYDRWYHMTGNGFPPHLYAIFKIMWCRNNLGDIYDRACKFIGTKDYINLKLTGVVATDHSYASGSGVYSLMDRAYSDEFLDVAGVDKEKLPCIKESSDIIGYLTKAAADELGLVAGIPVVCGGVDNACMSLGANCFEQGDMYASLGSSAWVTLSSSRPVLDIVKKPYNFAHCIPGMYIPSAGIFSAGSALKWVRENIFTELDAHVNPYTEIDSLSQKSPTGANGLVFNPSLAGGSSIERSPYIKGCLAGLDLSHTKSDIAKAVLEGIAINLKKAFDVVTRGEDAKPELLMAGGGSQSSVWRQIFADVFNMKIVKTDIGQNAAALGAAALAAVGCGLWKDYHKIRVLYDNRIEVCPIAENVKVYATLIQIHNQVSEKQAEIGEMTERSRNG